MLKFVLLSFLAHVSRFMRLRRTVTATAGTPSAVQAAIDSSSAGDTVTIPTGTILGIRW